MVHQPLTVLEYYATHFLAGMTDLSASSPSVATVQLEGAFDPGYSSPTHFHELRTAIAARYATLAAEDILVTSGASEALTAIGHVLLGPGRVLAASPATFPSLIESARRTGARVRPFAGDPTAADVVAVTNPSLPDGRWVDVARLAAACRAAHARLVCDEVYRDLPLHGRAAAAAADLDDRAVSVGDLSKPLGLGGLRIGWIATRDRALLPALDAELQLLTGGPSMLSAAAAQSALRTFDAAVSATAAQAREAQPRIAELLSEFGWMAAAPDAGLTIAARPPTPVSAESLAQLREQGLFLLPGEVLGQAGCLRFGMLAAEADVRRALAFLAAGPSGGRELIVLTKTPTRRRAKTRLAATLGAEAATKLAAAMLRDTLANTSDGRWSTRVAFTPADSEAELARVVGLDRQHPSRCCAQAQLEGLTFSPQVEGDLGDRILAALAQGLAAGQAAVLVGSDTPDLPASLIDEAFEALSTVDLVLGPAADGGFYLIGLRQADPRLFERVAWSTSTVAETVLRNAASRGYRVATLQLWEDVDDIASLERLEQRLRAGGTAPDTLAAFDWLAAEATDVE